MFILTLLLTCLIQSLIVKAIPPAFNYPIADPIESKQMRDFSLIARAMYTEHYPQLHNWTCVPCTYMADVRASKVILLTDDNTSAHHSIILVNDKLKSIILGFRGTDTVSAFMVDVMASLADLESMEIDTKAPIKAHYGFLAVYHFARDAIRAKVQELVTKYPDYSIQLTGHSLGGAVANLYAQDLARIHTKSKVVLTTFGSPRVGNEAYARMCDTLPNLETYRVVHANDPVPHLPPRSIGYIHSGQEYWIPISTMDAVVKCKHKVGMEDYNCSHHIPLLKQELYDHKSMEYLYIFKRLGFWISLLEGKVISE